MFGRFRVVCAAVLGLLLGGGVHRPRSTPSPFTPPNATGKAGQQVKLIFSDVVADSANTFFQRHQLRHLDYEAGQVKADWFDDCARRIKSHRDGR